MITEFGNGADAQELTRGNARRRCLVVHPEVRGTARSRTAAGRLEEAVGLAHGIDLDVVAAEIIKVTRVRPSTLLGKGGVDRLADIFSEAKEEDDPIEVCIMDAALTPVQQRNLERAWKTKVIDRTGLILEIFGERARTREGTLQVELAALTYQRSRLVRSWTHLERQRGGLSFIGGPGESQIETDRRLIDERIVRLNRELTDVARTRQLHRKARKRVPYPIVAFVGYTNAGKSTLFNKLTRSDVMVKDQLFATLDPTMRSYRLASGQKVILSDTVGFISDLPHELVAAFHATLEEVLEANVVVHVRDGAHPDSDAQKDDVNAVMQTLGLGSLVDNNDLIEVINKIDAVGCEERAVIENRSERQSERCFAISAKTGEGLAAFCGGIEAKLNEKRHTVETDVALHDGATLAWLYAHGEVLLREDDETEAHMSVRLDPADVERFRRMRDRK